jgi:hypothetical protein
MFGVNIQCCALGCTTWVVDHADTVARSRLLFPVLSVILFRASRMFLAHNLILLISIADRLYPEIRFTSLRLSSRDFLHVIFFTTVYMRRAFLTIRDSLKNGTENPEKDRREHKIIPTRYNYFMSDTQTDQQELSQYLSNKPCFPPGLRRLHLPKRLAVWCFFAATQQKTPHS